MSKNKKRASNFRPVKLVMVRGKEVECQREHINGILGRPLNSSCLYEGFSVVPSINDLKGWLAPMIFDVTSKSIP